MEIEKINQLVGLAAELRKFAKDNPKLFLQAISIETKEPAILEKLNWEGYEIGSVYPSVNGQGLTITFCSYDDGPRTCTIAARYLTDPEYLAAKVKERDTELANLTERRNELKRLAKADKLAQLKAEIIRLEQEIGGKQ